MAAETKPFSKKKSPVKSTPKKAKAETSPSALRKRKTLQARPTVAKDPGATGSRRPGSQIKSIPKKNEKLEPGSVGAACELLAEHGDLPDSYGETRVVLLPVDPYQVNVYWGINDQELGKNRKRLEQKYKHLQPALRFFDVTNIIFDGTNAHGVFDIAVDLQARNWYVHLWKPGKSYFVDLGFKTEFGLFFPIGRSNVAEIPPDRPQPKEAETLAVSKREVIPPIAGQQPRHALAEFQAAQVGHEEGVQIEYCDEAQPLLPSEVLPEKPVRAGKIQAAPEQAFRTEKLPARRRMHVRHGETDLADINEKSFVPGISSEAAASDAPE